MQLISRTSEYALRAVIWLVQEPARSQTTRQIATGTRTPPDYVSKVLQLLAKAGLVRSQRGLGGGFRVASDPTQITVLDVINAVDPLERIHTCPLGLKEHGTNLCPLHCGLNDVVLRMETTFAKTKLADLLNGETSSIPLGIKLKTSRHSAAPGLTRSRPARFTNKTSARPCPQPKVASDNLELHISHREGGAAGARHQQSGDRHPEQVARAADDAGGGPPRLD